jgi:hypothetical protein
MSLCVCAQAIFTRFPAVNENRIVRAMTILSLSELSELRSELAGVMSYSDSNATKCCSARTILARADLLHLEESVATTVLNKFQ